MRILLMLVVALIGWMPMANSKPAARKAFVIEPGLFTENPIVVINGKAIEPEGWSPLLFDLEDAMVDNQRAMELAHTQAIYGRASGIVLWSGMGIAAAYAAVTPRERFSPGIFWGTFGGSIVVSLGLEQVAKSYLYKAIRIYNGVDLTSKAISDLRFNLVPIEKGGAMTFAFDF